MPVDRKLAVTYIDNMKHVDHDIDSNVQATFGEAIRKMREAKAAEDSRFSLRQVATRCGVTAAYLSRVERGDVAPPGEETLLKLAAELDVNPDVMLAMAGKVSTELRNAIMTRPKLFGDLIRQIRQLPDHAILKIVRDVKDGNW